MKDLRPVRQANSRNGKITFLGERAMHHTFLTKTLPFPACSPNSFLVRNEFAWAVVGKCEDTIPVVEVRQRTTKRSEKVETPKNSLSRHLSLYTGWVRTGECCGQTGESQKNQDTQEESKGTGSCNFAPIRLQRCGKYSKTWVWETISETFRSGLERKPERKRTSS